MRFLLLLLTSMAVGCVDIAVQEDNDTFTCDTTDEPCETEIIDAPQPRDACQAAGITNLLVGACWWEQCRDNEKSLYPKLSGVPCVYIPKSGNSPWVEGTCSGEGACVGSVP